MTAFARLEPRSVDVIITRVPTVIFVDAPRERRAARDGRGGDDVRDIATTRTDDARDAKVTAGALDERGHGTASGASSCADRG
jgi:hypothetical protein